MFAPHSSSPSSSSSSSSSHHRHGSSNQHKNLKVKFTVLGFIFIITTLYTIRYRCFDEDNYEYSLSSANFGEHVPNDANAFASNLHAPMDEDDFGEREEEKASGAGGEDDEDEDDEKEPVRSSSGSDDDSVNYNLPNADASMPCGGQPREMLPFEKERQLRRKILADLGTDDDDDNDKFVKSRITTEEHVFHSNASSLWNSGSSDSSSSSDNNDNNINGTRRRRRNLLHRGIGFTMGKAGCGKELYVRVVHENDGPGNIVSKRVFSQEQTLNECLTRDPTLCREKDSLTAAKKLPGVRGLKKLPKVGLSPLLGKGKKFGTCAIVGNAGHLMTKPYGKYIDAHDVVVRFNILPTTGFEKHVGTKTTLRVLNGRRSIALCCRGNFPEGKAGNEDTGVLIWFPAAQGEILSACKKRFPNNPRFALPLKLSKSLAGAMNKLRTDASRLGLTGFTQWRQMTSGAHAILLFSQLCDTVNVYGFGSFPGKEKAPDQYGGRTARARSGTIWHDWSGEKNVNKLLHAAEVINVCSA